MNALNWVFGAVREFLAALLDFCYPNEENES